MFNKNLIILSISQVCSFTAASLTVFLSGIIATNMIQIKSLATLPAALMIVGTALGSLIASYTMSKVGRKYGFIYSSLLISFISLVASYSVFNNYFYIYCLANLIMGISQAFAVQYRFAAAESVSKKYIPNAISLILFAGMAGALIGPNLATITKDFIPNGIYTGSYIFLSIVTFLPVLFFIFYIENPPIKISKINVRQKRSYFLLLIQPKFFQAVVGAGLGYCTMALLMTATPISMHIHQGISIGKTGIVIMFHIIAMFSPSIITGKLIKKFGHNNIMYVGVFILFLSIFSNFIGQNFYNYLLGLIFLGTGWNFLFISGTSLLITSYEPHEKFRAQGLNDFIVFSTQAVGALSAGFLLNILGWKNINLLCIPLLILIITTIFLVNNYFKKT